MRHMSESAWLPLSPHISTVSAGLCCSELTGSPRPSAPGYAQCTMGLSMKRIHGLLQVKVLRTYFPRCYSTKLATWAIRINWRFQHKSHVHTLWHLWGQTVASDLFPLLSAHLLSATKILRPRKSKGRVQLTRQTVALPLYSSFVSKVQNR